MYRVTLTSLVGRKRGDPNITREGVARLLKRALIRLHSLDNASATLQAEVAMQAVDKGKIISLFNETNGTTLEVRAI